jgi:Ferritin-like domain
VTRRDALAAAVGVALLCPARAAAQASDREQLERLLALEHRLEAAYETALARNAIEPRLGESLLAHEREHARGLGRALAARGGRAPRATAPPPRLGAAFADRAAFARFATDLEAETVSAYQEALATLRDARLLRPLGSIMAAGAQHQVALRQEVGEELLR